MCLPTPPSWPEVLQGYFELLMYHCLYLLICKGQIFSEKKSLLQYYNECQWENQINFIKLHCKVTMNGIDMSH